MPIKTPLFRRKKAAPDLLKQKLTDDTPFQVKEAYKTVRANLLFSLAAQKNKFVVITSASPKEGKSTTCCNLAITIAQTQSRVLIIDADLRGPVQHRFFQENNGTGLASLLTGDDSLHDALKVDVAPNLDLVPAGPAPPNPSELLGCNNMTVLLQMLSEHYDYIFIDTPPVNVVSDALVLAGKAAGVVLVARQRSSTYDELTRTVGTLEFSGANILGMVISNASEKRGGYGSHLYRKYQNDYAVD